MSLWRRERQVEERSVVWPGYPFPPSQLGLDVDDDRALRSAAVWACQRVLVATVSKMPVDVVQVRGTERLPVRTTPPLISAPSDLVSRRGWVAQVIRSLVQSGNAYGRITAVDNDGRPLKIETITPQSVTWRVKAGVETPHVDGKAEQLWPLGNFWHVPASQFLVPGTRVALSPTHYAMRSISTALAAEQFGTQFFTEGAHPAQVAYVDQDITAQQADAIKQRLLAMRGSREPAVFGSGVKLEAMQVSPSDSQFLELLRFEVEQACRFWGVPPSMVFLALSGQAVTYSNVTQDDLHFLKHSVEAWLVDIEDALSALLSRPQSVKFNVDSVLRMDTTTRYAAHATALAAGFLTINEVRALEDLPPLGDPTNG